MRLFGSRREGLGTVPPLDRWAVDCLYVKDENVTRVFSMQDDGGFVGIGYPDEWHAIIRWRCARMFAWWVLRQWVRDWFGLRSRLYFRALNAHVSGSWARLGSSERNMTRRTTHEEWRRESAAVPERGE